MSSDAKRLRQLVNEELIKLFEYRPNTFMLSRMEEQDQDGDGDEDFDDVRVARYVAGGMKKDKALGKVKQKPMGQKGRKDEIAAETGSLAESIQRMTLRERKMLHESIKRRILKEESDVKTYKDGAGYEFQIKDGKLYLTKDKNGKKRKKEIPNNILNQTVANLLAIEAYRDDSDLESLIATEPGAAGSSSGSPDIADVITRQSEKGAQFSILWHPEEKKWQLEIVENPRSEKEYYRWIWEPKTSVQDSLTCFNKVGETLTIQDLDKSLAVLTEKYPIAFKTFYYYNKSGDFNLRTIEYLKANQEKEVKAIDAEIERKKETTKTETALADIIASQEAEEDFDNPQTAPEPETPAQSKSREAPVGSTISKDGKEIYRKTQAGWTASLRATSDQILSIVKPANRAQVEKELKSANQGDKINLETYVLINPDLATTFTKDGEEFVDPKIIPDSVIDKIQRLEGAGFNYASGAGSQVEKSESGHRFAVGDAIIDYDADEKKIKITVPDDRTGRFTGFEGLFGSDSDIAGKIQAASNTKSPGRIKLSLGLAKQGSVMEKFSRSILRGLGIGAVVFNKRGDSWVAEMSGGRRTENLKDLLIDLEGSGQAREIRE